MNTGIPANLVLFASLDADADADALDAHIEATMPQLLAAFSAPPPDDFPVGSEVWMLDHYNTATITAPGELAGRWTISTMDADGTISTYTYETEYLRPASSPVDFLYPSIR
jgi:hypothetical protein